jgi:methionyl-tRNA formyltransferase
MFDTILLLTSPVEQQAFTSLLLEFNPWLKIIAVLTSAELSDVSADVLQQARLIAFTTSVIVPRSILDRLGFGAYNFHPGPPEYPGWAPAHFALYDRAREFGVTSHAMLERVDEGAIVQVDRFDIPPGSTVASLEEVAYMQLVRMFWGMAKALATEPAPLPSLPVGWSNRKNTRRRYASLCDIPFDISSDDLHRRMEVFGDNHFGMAPTIRLHGVEFRAVKPETKSA